MVHQNFDFFTKRRVITLDENQRLMASGHNPNDTIQMNQVDRVDEIEPSRYGIVID